MLKGLCSLYKNLVSLSTPKLANKQTKSPPLNISKAKSDDQGLTEASNTRKRHQFLLASKKVQGSGFSETHWSSWQRDVLPDRSSRMSRITVSWPGGAEGRRLAWEEAHFQKCSRQFPFDHLPISSPSFSQHQLPQWWPGRVTNFKHVKCTAQVSQGLTGQSPSWCSLLQTGRTSHPHPKRGYASTRSLNTPGGTSPPFKAFHISHCFALEFPGHQT